MAAAAVIHRCITSTLPSVARINSLCSLHYSSHPRPSLTHHRHIIASTCPRTTLTRQLSTVPDPPDYDINLTPQQLNKIKSECYLVDVRQPEELLVDRPIAGAHNIPLGELPGHIENVPDNSTVFICQGGVRSLKALSLALQAGIEKPRQLQGGMNAWNAEFHGK